jgi:pimeloyl-ACP methyl ester carboxylesterase
VATASIWATPSTCATSTPSGDVHAATLYGQARLLWRGEPELPDTPAADALRRRLRDEQLQLAEAQLASTIDAGAPNEAVAELGALVAAEPLNERLWELRILALYRSGRPTDALRAYGEVRTLLAEQIGVEPGPALRQLEAAILDHAVPAGPLPDASRATASPPRASGFTYARAGGTHIAHRTYGHGDPPVLLLNPGLISIDSHLDEPHLARAIAQLADGRRVVAFDPRGIGLSDRTQPPHTITIDDWVEDAVAVLDDTGIDAAHVFAGGHGGSLAMALAHAHPARVRSLTMVNPFARFTAADDYPFGFDATAFADVQERMQTTDPRPGVDALTLISPSVAADPDYREWWNAAGRRAASPVAAAALVTTMARADLRAIVAHVSAPTLLLVRRGCPVYDTGHADYLVAHLPDVRIEEHHDVNDPWWLGDTGFLLDAFARFLAPRR